MINVPVSGEEISSIEKDLRAIQLGIDGMERHCSDEISVGLTHLAESLAAALEPLIERFHATVEDEVPIIPKATKKRKFTSEFCEVGECPTWHNGRCTHEKSVTNKCLKDPNAEPPPDCPCETHKPES